MISIRNSTLKCVDILFTGDSGDITPAQVGGLVPAVDDLSVVSASPAAPPPPLAFGSQGWHARNRCRRRLSYNRYFCCTIPAAAAAAAAATVVRAALPSVNTSRHFFKTT